MSEQPRGEGQKPDSAKEDLRKHEPQPATRRDTQSPVWDMSQERIFIETLLNQRFNFFMVFFGFVMAGSVNAKSEVILKLLLTLGLVVCILFALVLRRSQEKLDLIIADLQTDTSHPVTLIDAQAKQGGSRRRLIGVGIPTLCCTVLGGATIAAWCGIFHLTACLPTG